MKLLIGLGNPGQKYERTRHNAGFWVVDQLAHEVGAQWDDSKLDKFSGWIAKAKVDGVDCVFLKPTTFMNLSGSSVQKFAQFLKISATDWIVFHDDIDLPVHKVRFREGGGGHGGHNGLRSIMEVTGRADFSRIKLGVGRPPKLESGEAGMDVADYVLQNMPEKEVAAYVSAFMPEVKMRLKDLLKQ